MDFQESSGCEGSGASAPVDETAHEVAYAGVGRDREQRKAQLGCCYCGDYYDPKPWPAPPSAADEPTAEASAEAEGGKLPQVACRYRFRE
jgi:hypothetical protein